MQEAAWPSFVLYLISYKNYALQGLISKLDFKLNLKQRKYPFKNASAACRQETIFIYFNSSYNERLFIR